MIPKNFIEQWGKIVQWQNLVQIEQDLIISRVLVCLYNELIYERHLFFEAVQHSINCF